MTIDPVVSVVIPTYNRSPTLISCLEHLERQSCRAFEVIIVDDGSTDDTAGRVQEYLTRTMLPIRLIRQANAGPARARNVAISLARTPLILMIGDDILATPMMVERHLRLHHEFPDPRVAALGLTVWDTETQHITPFMRFLEDLQFLYAELLAGTPPSWKQFYTSNLSVKTELLRKNPFCERFPGAAMEDVELGFRLARSGSLKMFFLPEALAHHVHPTTFTQACRRMRNVGWATHLFHELWPESYSDPMGANPAKRLLRQALISTHLLGAATRSAAFLSLFCTPHGAFQAILNTHLYLGYRDREMQMLASSNGFPETQD